MSKVANLFTFLGAYLVFNFKGNLAFRTSFALQVVSMILNDFIWVVFWMIYFAKFPVVHGWHQADILYLWGLTATSFGLMSVLFGNITNIGQIVSSGELDVYLSNPKPVLFHLLISRQSTSAWGDVLFGSVVLCVSTPYHGLVVAETFGALLASFLILFGFSLLSQSLVFFTRGRDGLGLQLIQSFITVATYPSGIFHNALVKVIIFGVIPAAFISSLPSAILDGAAPQMLFVAILVGAIELWFGRLLFYRGMKTYTSGNRITVRS